MPRCDHVAFRVADLEASIRFYTEMLPGEVVRRKSGKDLLRTEVAYVAPSGDDTFVVVLLHPRRVRWLLAVGHRLFPRQFRSSEHVGFACPSREEVDARHRAAKSRGDRVADGPRDLPAGEGYILEVRDPDGNGIEWTHGKRLR